MAEETKHKDAIKGSPFLEESTPENHGGVSYAAATGLAVATKDGLVPTDELTPLTVQASITEGPQIRGYIPNKRRLALMIQRGQVKRAKEQKKEYDNHTLRRVDIPLITGPPGFLSGKISKGIREKKETKVLELAKRIRDTRKKQWKKYRHSRELVAEYEGKLSEGKDTKLDAKIREAVAIMKNDSPPSYKKEICMSAARIQVYHRS